MSLSSEINYCVPSLFSLYWYMKEDLYFLYIDTWKSYAGSIYDFKWESVMGLNINGFEIKKASKTDIPPRNFNRCCNNIPQNFHSQSQVLYPFSLVYTWISNYIHYKIWDEMTSPFLTHWGRVTHICVGKLTIIGSDNGLSPRRRQAIIWTNAGILLIGPLGTNFSEIQIGIQTFSFKKMYLKMGSAKWRPFCLGLNVFNFSGATIQV